MAPSDPALAAPAPLRAAELTDVLALVAEAGWNQTERDWRIFLDYGSVNAVRTSAGRVVATAATLPYGGFGWISMVLVTPAYRRQGLAKTLLRGAIDDLLACGCVPVLDATPAGRDVYRTLGFEDTWGFTRFARDAVTKPLGTGDALPRDVRVDAVTDAVWPDLCSYDAAVFGADRRQLLACLRGRLARADLTAWRDDRLVGFLLGREGRLAWHLGPLIADDAVAARALLSHALDTIAGPIFVDLADAKAETRTFIETHGFTAVRPLTRMVQGRSTAFDDGERTFAVVGPEFG